MSDSADLGPSRHDGASSRAIWQFDRMRGILKAANPEMLGWKLEGLPCLKPLGATL